MPNEGAEKSPKNAQLIEYIKAGKTTAQIIEENPVYAFKIPEIDRLRQLFLGEKYLHELRMVDVTYLYGITDKGKTRGIYAKHGLFDVCRITYYGYDGMPRFDNYSGHSVLVLEEFSSKPPIEFMLNLLDIYPLLLPARFADKVACYFTVYITSNMPLDAQYLRVQAERPATWQAFCRRIHHVQEFKEDGTIVTHK